MLTTTRKGWLFCRNYEIREGGDSIGEVELEEVFPMSRGRNRVVSRGTEYSVTHEGSSVQLQGPAGTVADAKLVTKLGFLAGPYRLTYGGRELTLKDVSFWSRGSRFILLDGETEIGTIRLAGVNHYRADLPEEVPLEVRLFILWLSFSLIGPS